MTISALRRRAEKLGLAIQTSRSGRVHADDHGGYRLINIAHNTVIAGARFELELVDLETEIAHWEAAQ